MREENKYEIIGDILSRLPIGSIVIRLSEDNWVCGMPVWKQNETRVEWDYSIRGELGAAIYDYLKLSEDHEINKWDAMETEAYGECLDSLEAKDQVGS